MTTTRALSLFDALSDQPGEFAGRKFGRIDLLHLDLPGFGALFELDAQGGGPGFERGEAFVEGENDGVVAALGRRDGILDGDGRFSRAGGPHQQSAGAAIGPAAQQRIERRDAALDAFAVETARYVPTATSRGKTIKPAFANGKIVVAAAKTGSAEFHDAQPAPLGAIDRGQLLQRNDAVGDALKLEVRAFGCSVVEQQHGAFAADEKLLQGQNLPAITQRALGQQPKFGERVENDAAGIDLFDRRQNLLGRFGQLNFGGVIHRHLRIAVEIFSLRR